MKRYQADYETRRHYYECMTMIPDPENAYDSHVFDAKDDEDAREVARDYIPVLLKQKGYLRPTMRILRIREVKEVPLKKPEPSQLELFASKPE